MTMWHFADEYRPPRVHLLLSRLEVTAGETVAISCFYAGKPRPALWWLNDGTYVSTTWKKTRSLVVEVRNVNESFILKCMAANGVDWHAVEMFVNVTGGRRDNKGLFTVVYKLATRLLTPQR